ALIGLAREATTLPLIASGGAGVPEHFPPAVHAGADAVLAASVFHFQPRTIAEAKAAMAADGITVRGVPRWPPAPWNRGGRSRADAGVRGLGTPGGGCASSSWPGC